ncbi:MAG TPA: metal-dependent hydrolase [Myxococcota bacterium]|nr:metal-dependent hydrolase [Myxococcota bacterium]
MPSAIAHGLFGAALSSLLPRRQRAKWVVALLAALAAAPDLDVVAFRLGIPYEHPLGHRGVTHSLFFAACVALASIPFWRRALQASAGAASLLTFVAVASHGVLDTFTDAGRGIGLFIPFDNDRYFAPWRPILTSPLSASRFLSERGLAILQNEVRWVGVPTLAFVATVAAARSILRARRDAA